MLEVRSDPMLEVVSPGAGGGGWGWPGTEGDSPGGRGRDLTGGQGGGGWSVSPLLTPGLCGMFLQARSAAVPWLWVSSLQCGV